ncbi:22713_t:CDS:2, partial [Gigaspora margarita]
MSNTRQKKSALLLKIQTKKWQYCFTLSKCKYDIIDKHKAKTDYYRTETAWDPRYITKNRRDPYHNGKHTSTKPAQQLDKSLDPRNEIDVDLILREASVDIILEERDSKNNTENQQISYSQAVTRFRELQQKQYSKLVKLIEQWIAHIRTVVSDKKKLAFNQ